MKILRSNDLGIGSEDVDRRVKDLMWLTIEMKSLLTIVFF